MKVSNKISMLASIDTEIGSQYARIMNKVDFVNFTNPAAVQGQAGPAQQPRGQRYNPNMLFLDQNRQKPWYTTASNQISVSDITFIEE